MAEGLTIMFLIILVPTIGFAIWLHTPQGSRFLQSLD